jgi:hypothetical protein
MSRDKNKIKMKRINACITDNEYNQLIEDVNKTGLSISDILRRIIDEHYGKNIVAGKAS